MSAHLLLVEDDDELGRTLQQALQREGYRVTLVADAQAARELLLRERTALVIAELGLRRQDSVDLLEAVRQAQPTLPLLFLAAGGQMEQAVAAMRDGAADCLSKPFDTGLLLGRVRAQVPPAPDDEVVVEDLRSRELLELAGRVARSNATVMICGESGTGKEVFARFIHRQSPRRDHPFVAINCAAIPENMLEAVLFGHEKGAFTGAHQSAPGKFEMAQGGTLLLDEISEMSLALQAKLLRVLQEKEVERVGGRRLIPLDVRVLATTNRNLREEVAAGRFREDLYYRLNVFPLYIPPLRERQRDLLPLARFLLRRHCRAQSRPVPELDEEAGRLLLGHHWPGNVRELDNVVQRALILCDGARIGAAGIRFEADAPGHDVAAGSSGQRRLSDDLRSVEEQMILDALAEGNGSRKQAAERLGISQRTLRYKIARLRDAGVAIPG
ncbi:MAG TPA: sigma-54-dependent Fis family transcriptional regulator [Sedimenticola thiotaurini]|uniref:Sigma-54-dependent Fis family transcriptional regulator n=1 Tax=Sedimenticola thiotaurini TaxID=1543721 RepID=A0A831RPD1_9GAMM|nr:sigma-54-dependent Fis family transcriptional regulator [Sedimenticola thiotaurini]